MMAKRTKARAERLSEAQHATLEADAFLEQFVSNYKSVRGASVVFTTTGVDGETMVAIGPCSRSEACTMHADASELLSDPESDDDEDTEDDE